MPPLLMRFCLTFRRFFLKYSTVHWGHAEVAQSVEQGTENPRVGSSILSLGTSRIKGLG